MPNSSQDRNAVSSPAVPTAGAPAPRLSRRAFTGGAAAAAGATVLAGVPTSLAGTRRTRVARKFGDVRTSPRLPRDFAKTFKSRFVRANGIVQHVVVGGDGPPLLLLHGWPENWYAWRFVMPALARHFTVVVPDQRGIGLSEKASTGYDSATLAKDLAKLMTALGHRRFAVVGHDTGYIIGYALAADHRDRVVRLALAEIPGPPTVVDSPDMFIEEPFNNKLWHIPFNRVNDELIVDMVHSNADAYYRYEYAIQGGEDTLPDYAINYYVDLFTRDRTALRASFGLYRAWDATLAQNKSRRHSPLEIPVLGIGGSASWGPFAGDAMRAFATDVQTVVVPNCGHWVAEQAPNQLLRALNEFLTGYRAA
jgi:pimeloyl-ACP methyl ester carboxylesterase